MDPIDRMLAWASAGLGVGMMLLSLVALVTIWPGQSSKSLLRDVPGADTLTATIDDARENDSADEQPPVDRPQAVAAVEATPAPAPSSGNPSPTPTPARVATDLPATPRGARVSNETPLSPSPPALQTPAPATLVPPPTTPTRTPTPQPTPAPTPLDSCLQAESGIVVDHNRLRIARGSVVSYGAGVLVLATADGPISLVITADTLVTGDLTVATQVRVEAHRTGSGKIVTQLVEVLCPHG